MSKNPRRFDDPTRLIVSVEQRVVGEVDEILSMHGAGPHPHGNRAEFVRLAIERELERCQCDFDD